MTVTFFINYLNHHQQPVADEMFGLLGEDFRFVATFPRDENALKGGQDYSTRPYCILAAESDEANAMAHRLVTESDLCVFGAGNLYWERLRAKTGKLSFEVSERWFKRGIINILSPRLLKWLWLYHTRLRRLPFYKLCASAYTAPDCHKLKAFRDRCFKWGYFPALHKSIDAEKYPEDSETQATKILWVARFLRWKHPEIVVNSARQLVNEGYSFTIDMYGDGPEREKTIEMVKRLDLSDYINFPGAVPNTEVMKAMAEADIFLFTSDRNEGWGAVLNEAMGNGCCVIANDEIGSVPFLISNGENGFTYSNGNQYELNNILMYLMKNPQEQVRIGIAARRDIETLWSPSNAARCLIKLSESLTNGDETPIIQGPCSKA